MLEDVKKTITQCEKVFSEMDLEEAERYRLQFENGGNSAPCHIEPVGNGTPGKRKSLSASLFETHAIFSDEQEPTYTAETPRKSKRLQIKSNNEAEAALEEKVRKIKEEGQKKQLKKPEQMKLLAILKKIPNLTQKDILGVITKEVDGLVLQGERHSQFLALLRTGLLTRTEEGTYTVKLA